MGNLASAHNRPEIRYAWRGPSLLVLDNEARAGDNQLAGYFFRETRYLIPTLRAAEIDLDTNRKELTP